MHSATARSGTSPQHVIASTSRLLFLRGIERCLSYVGLQLLMTVVVDRLTMVAVGTKAHHVVLHHGTVREDILVGVARLWESDRVYRHVLLVLCRTVANRDGTIARSGILTWSPHIRKNDGERLLLSLLHISDKREFVKQSIIVKIIELAGKFLAIECHEC